MYPGTVVRGELLRGWAGATPRGQVLPCPSDPRLLFMLTSPACNQSLHLTWGITSSCFTRDGCPFFPFPQGHLRSTIGSGRAQAQREEGKGLRRGSCLWLCRQHPTTNSGRQHGGASPHIPDGPPHPCGSVWVENQLGLCLCCADWDLHALGAHFLQFWYVCVCLSMGFEACPCTPGSFLSKSWPVLLQFLSCL